MKTVLHACPIDPAFANLRKTGDFPAGISGCYLAADGRFAVRFGAREIAPRYADAVGNAVLLADEERCYQYRL